MCQQTLGCRVSWLTSCVEWYHGSVWTYADFTIDTPVSAHAVPKKWCWVIIYVHEHTIQRRVLNWFSWNLHAWCRSTHGRTLLFLETIGPIEPPIGGKCAPKTSFFGFHSASMIFFMEKTNKQYVVPHSPQKRFNSILSTDANFASKMVMSPKNFFHSYFGKYVSFLKKLFNEKSLKPHYKKGYIEFCQ